MGLTPSKKVSQIKFELQTIQMLLKFELLPKGDADAAEDDVDGHAGPLPRPAEVGLPLPRRQPPGAGLPGTGLQFNSIFPLLSDTCLSYKIANLGNLCGRSEF